MSGSFDSLDDNLLTKITASVTDSTVKSAISSAYPKIKQIIEEERNRLSNALMGAVPFAAASAIVATLTYYLAPKDGTLWKVLGYSSAAAIAGAGGLYAFYSLRSTDAAIQAQAQAPSSSLDPVIQSATTQLIAQAYPKIQEVIQEEQARLATALQTGIPWAAGAAISALIPIFLVPDSMIFIKILVWIAVILLSSYGAWAALDVMKSGTPPNTLPG